MNSYSVFIEFLLFIHWIPSWFSLIHTLYSLNLRLCIFFRCLDTMLNVKRRGLSHSLHLKIKNNLITDQVAGFILNKPTYDM